VLWRSLGRPSPKSAPTETRKQTLTSALTNLLLTPDRAAHSAAIETGACAQRATDEMHPGAFENVRCAAHASCGVAAVAILVQC
jgi:hypothetical protein